MAHDPRMDILPLFISFPRTGAHWINCVMELYFDRPRLRENRASFLDRTRTNWMWFHDHDLKLNLIHPNVLLLYRAPVETIFSNLVYDGRRAAQSLLTRLFGHARADANNANELRAHCDRYRRHCEKYLCSADKARTVVRHDNFKTNRTQEFANICAHFGQPLNVERMEQSFATVTPEALVAKTGDTPAMGRHMLGDDYQTRRRIFTEQWRGLIEDEVITPELRPFFV
jgi:hypothetical protein